MARRRVPHTGFPKGLQVLRSVEVVTLASAAPGLVVFGAGCCTAASAHACLLREAAKISPGGWRERGFALRAGAHRLLGSETPHKWAERFPLRPRRCHVLAVPSVQTMAGAGSSGCPQHPCRGSDLKLQIFLGPGGWCWLKGTFVVHLKHNCLQHLVGLAVASASQIIESS